LIVSGLIVLAAAWPAYNVGIALGLWQPITRPIGVSRSARYVSLLEDATWFDCSVDLNRDVDVCKAWTPTGKLIADGEFRLEGEARAASKSELRPSRVLAKNGKAYMIYLVGQRGAFSKALVPVSSEREQ
jgi:hypothetical protein